MISDKRHDLTNSLIDLYRDMMNSTPTEVHEKPPNSWVMRNVIKKFSTIAKNKNSSYNVNTSDWYTSWGTWAFSHFTLLERFLNLQPMKKFLIEHNDFDMDPRESRKKLQKFDWDRNLK
jgi:hypothetical protein